MADDIEHHGRNDRQVFFYEREFYVLSNFSAFHLDWYDQDFDTSEHAYHWTKFNEYTSRHRPMQRDIQRMIIGARSAHDAFKIAEKNRVFRRADWDDVKLTIMSKICRAKAEQHEYVRRKLLETDNRELIEDSWRDDFWGWGPNKDGLNHLGKIWMQVRSEILASHKEIE